MMPSESLQSYILRKIIRTGCFKGIPGSFGRFVGRTWGCPLAFGGRVRIRNPHEYIQRQIISRRVYEPEIATLVAHIVQKDAIFFDVGANIGNHTITAAANGARVFSFEPVTRVADALRQNVKLSGLSERVTVVEQAAGEAPGNAVAFIASRSDDGSHSLIKGVDADAVQEQVVSVTTLDGFAEGQGGVMPDLIKIDVEGFESPVLRGATQLLVSGHPPIVIVETADRLAAAIGETANSALLQLFEAGYHLAHIVSEGKTVPVRRDQISGELRNYIAVHVRSRLIQRLPAWARPSPDCF